MIVCARLYCFCIMGARLYDPYLIESERSRKLLERTYPERYSQIIPFRQDLIEYLLLLMKLAA